MGNGFLFVGFVHFYLDFMTAEVELNHEEDRLRLFLSLEKLRRIGFHLSEFLVIFADWFVLLLFFLDSGFLLADLHSVDCLVVAVDRAASFIGRS